MGIPPNHTICTGDTVAYCADPQATVDVIRATRISVVMGNTEESLAADANDCGCGFDGGSACDRLSTEWYGFARSALDSDAKRWMAHLPRSLRLTVGGRRLLVVHGAPSSINRFIFASAPVFELARELEAAACDGVLAGHSGLPFCRIIDGRLWHNAGVIGMPANDGTPRVWYSVLWPEGDGLVAERRALTYDHQRAAAKMQARGLPNGYADALETGLWPSLDILPPKERTRRGQALEWESLFWGESRGAILENSLSARRHHRDSWPGQLKKTQ